MKPWTEHRRIVSLTLLFVFSLSPGIITVGAQSRPPATNGDQCPYSSFTPSTSIIIVVVIAAVFFMGFFFIYIRHCSGASGAGGSIGRALSMRSRRTARGLDPSIIETFPTFSYSEVKDHKIGKEALECVVCLNEFEDDETLRLLPKCDHVFHPECIDAWLESHVTCPVCRVNLVPPPLDEPAQVPESTGNNNSAERSSSRRDEIMMQADENQPQRQRGPVDPNSGYEFQSGPPRSGSLARPRVFDFAKFKSHSTGQSFVQPGENLERFTLRLPEEIWNEVMDRATLNRTRSCTTTLRREGSSKRAHKTGEGEGTSRVARIYRRIESSNRFVYLAGRRFSMRSTKVVAETGDGDGSSRTAVKLPSFKCLDPVAADETVLFSDDPSHRGLRLDG